MRFTVSLRTVVLLGLVVALPLVALPFVSGWINGRLLGSPPSDLGPPLPLFGPAEAVVQPVFAERVSPASFEESGELSASRLAGLDTAGPPPLAPLSTFVPLVPPDSVPATDEEILIDDQTIARLQEIRQRLEEMGAEYVLAETTNGGGRYRFHCRMIVDPKTRFTRPFEATSPDPLLAGEQVLREVEAWRTAAVEKLMR